MLFSLVWLNRNSARVFAAHRRHQLVFRAAPDDHAYAKSNPVGDGPIRGDGQRGLP
jgi:hypothetical protein